MSRSTDEWKTPADILSFFEGWDDPCQEKSDDGLLRPWGNRAFINPPYSRPLPWVQKAILEAQQGKGVIMLLKHDSSTEWWRQLHEAGAHFFAYVGRMHFSGKGRAPFPSVLVMIGNRISREQKEKKDATH